MTFADLSDRSEEGVEPVVDSGASGSSRLIALTTILIVAAGPVAVMVAAGPLWTWRVFVGLWAVGGSVWGLNAVGGLFIQRRSWPMKPELRWTAKPFYGRSTSRFTGRPLIMWRLPFGGRLHEWVLR